MPAAASPEPIPGRTETPHRAAKSRPEAFSPAPGEPGIAAECLTNQGLML